MVRRLFALTGALAGIGAASAFGQNGEGESQSGDYFNRERTQSVTQRRAAREDEGAWRVGLLRVQPVLSIEAGYTDNFDASEVDAQSSPVYRVNGALSIESDWARHSFSAQLATPTTFYEGYWTTGDYTASLNGRLDVDRSLSLSGDVRFADAAEPVGYADPGVTLDEPARFQTTGVGVGFSKVWNRLRLSGEASYDQTDYEDLQLAGGGTQNVDSRDVAVTSYGLRAEVAVTEDTSVFVAARSIERDHEAEPALPADNLDSEGVEYFAGVSFDVSAVWRGDVSLGAFEQSYDAPGREDETGFAARGTIEWFPDETVSVTLGVERSIQESNNSDAATLVGEDASLDLVYELRRDVNISVGAGYSRDEYVESDREDTRWQARIGVDYDLNRNVALTFSASHNEQSSAGLDAGRNYDANVGLIGIRFRP